MNIAETNKDSAYIQSGRLAVVLSLAVFVFIVVRSAWLSDDAYITFRTVDNFTNGYGLRWNIDERVQTYTNPLWMLLTSAAYFVSREIYYTILCFSIIVSAAAVALIASRLARSFTVAILSVTILTCSKAFVDFSTSGLENPLTHLLLALFFITYLSGKLGEQRIPLLSLLASLCVVNRLDTALLLVPALAVALYERRSWRNAAIILLGAAPLLVWELFSLSYYGFLVPNTAYAKLNAGVSAARLAERGGRYLIVSGKLDPLTVIVITVGIVAPFIMRDRRTIPIAIGILFYVVYVTKIGGDFMVGRFLTAPFFCAIVVMVAVPFVPKTSVWVPIFALVLLVGALIPLSPLRSTENYGADHEQVDKDIDKNYGIADERAYYYPGSGLLRARRGLAMPTDTMANKGREIRVQGTTTVQFPAIGYYGFFAGPQVRIVDNLGIGDALLARLPPIRTTQFRVGHFKREVPAGYFETRATGRNVIQDPRVAQYYDKLAIITKGPLFSKQRWIEMIKFNLGRYNDLIPPPSYR